ncbi:hypothetical protein B0H16DRAFT_1736833 [Mycena metata]|uniref:Uncharacterized protein n=1 Tax=Mycena metata TaxID=1033252 RepID=A0AAD7MMT1_9AGAR|nr:hypothetical protein B0H16DRAFT_1736833 [Mycena metata]
MPHVLASLESTDITLTSGDTDDEGRVVRIYTDKEGEPLQALVLGELLHTERLDHATRVLVLGPPPETAPLIRDMFYDQHKLLSHLQSSGDGNSTKLIIGQQIWCTTPPSPAVIFVRITARTGFEIRDFSGDDSANPFTSAASDIPAAVPGTTLTALDQGALLFCAADMFEADLPVTLNASSSHSIYTKTRALNASDVVRMIRRVA